MPKTMKKTPRMTLTDYRTTGIRLLVSLFTLTFCETLLQAEQSHPASTVEGDATGWTVRCTTGNGGLHCEATQEIRLKTTQQLLVATVVSLASDNKQPTMLIKLPHGLFLPDGVSINLGTRSPQQLRIQTCDAAGCYAGMPISADMLSALQSEQEMTVSFEDLERRRITVRVMLVGFGAAYQKIK
jgi:invasion protein IalB